MDRKIFWLVSVVVLWAMLMLSLGNVPAQTPDQVAKFDAAGNPVDSAITETGGNVGVGTTNPPSGFGRLQIFSADAGGTSRAGIGLTNGAAGGRPYQIWSSDNSNGEGGGKLIFHDLAGGPRMVINGSGDVGIGTTNPRASLEVAGRPEWPNIWMSGEKPTLVFKSTQGPSGNQHWALHTGFYSNGGLEFHESPNGIDYNIRNSNQY